MIQIDAGLMIAAIMLITVMAVGNHFDDQNRQTAFGKQLAADDIWKDTMTRDMTIEICIPIPEHLEGESDETLAALFKQALIESIQSVLNESARQEIEKDDREFLYGTGERQPLGLLHLNAKGYSKDVRPVHRETKNRKRRFPR